MKFKNDKQRKAVMSQYNINRAGHPRPSTYKPPQPSKVNRFNEDIKRTGYKQSGEKYEQLLKRNESENKHIFVRRWNGVIQIIDKKTGKTISLYNHADDNTDLAIRHGIESFNENTTQKQLIDEIENKNKQFYHSTLHRSESVKKKIPKMKIADEVELKQRYKEIPDKPVNIRVKSKGSWNSVNRNHIPLVLKHSTVECSGHYTDDYAHDTAVNYGRDTSSDNCKISIINDVQSDPEGYSFIKLYYDDGKKDFVIYYGQWLSYRAKPDKNLNVNTKHV